jgi:hypothetical protein
MVFTNYLSPKIVVKILKSVIFNGKNQWSKLYLPKVERYLRKYCRVSFPALKITLDTRNLKFIIEILYKQDYKWKFTKRGINYKKLITISCLQFYRYFF